MATAVRKPKAKSAQFPARARTRLSLASGKAASLRKQAIKAIADAAPMLAMAAVTPQLTTALAGARAAPAAGKNQRLLDRILGGHFPDDTKLDPPFDGLARAGLAARIRRESVPVDPARIVACTTVGCVRKEMNRVNPGGQ